MAQISKNRNGERGVTIVLVAVAMVTILAMAALSIDVVTLYVARSEAQRAADAAALAAAKMFVTSGFTSWQLGDPNSSTVQDKVCISGGPGAAAIANKQAEEVADRHQIAGQPATIQSINCNFRAAGENPEITATVQRTDLPTFFGRIWGTRVINASASATAEAYNPSGSSSIPIQVGSVKPWLVPNCDPTGAAVPPATCPGPPYFVNPTDGSIANNGAYIGQPIPISLVQQPTTPPGGQFYYALNVPIAPPTPACPSGSALGCNQVGSGPYYDNIACSATFQFSCGQTIGLGQPVSIDPGTGGGSLEAKHTAATQCLIHADNGGLGSGQDSINTNPVAPVTIIGGDNNPNPALRGVNNISRSDSIVTVPLYDGRDMCPAGSCNITATVVGFLQLGITKGNPGGNVDAVILNASGCPPIPTGNAVSGGGISPIPVRLIHQ